MYDGTDLILKDPVGSITPPSNLKQAFTLGETMTAGDVAYIADDKIYTADGYRDAGTNFYSGSSVTNNSAKSIMIDADTIATVWHRGSLAYIKAGTISGGVITYGTEVSLGVNQSTLDICKADTNTGCVFLLNGTSYQ